MSIDEARALKYVKFKFNDNKIVVSVLTCTWNKLYYGRNIYTSVLLHYINLHFQVTAKKIFKLPIKTYSEFFAPPFFKNRILE